jgi:hypothetical protein
LTPAVFEFFQRRERSLESLVIVQVVHVRGSRVAMPSQGLHLIA